MSLKTIEQERADFTYNHILSVKGKGTAGEYKSIVRGFSSMILLNGLGQALAFLKAKGKGEKTKPHEILYSQINEWLKKKFGGNDFDILAKIRSEDSSRYRLYTKETMAYLVWLKKFAEAELEEEK